MLVELRSLSKGLVETDLDLYVQDDKQTVGLTEELLKVIVDDEEPTRVLKIGRNLKQGRFDELVRFLRANLDAFAWSHEDMVGIHPDLKCHRLNIDPEKKPIR